MTATMIARQQLSLEVELHPRLAEVDEGQIIGTERVNQAKVG